MIGGQTFSLNALEHGVLRGNVPGPYTWSAPFRSGDPRAGAVLPLDVRIHFALNCGATSCPAVRWSPRARRERAGRPGETRPR